MKEVSDPPSCYHYYFPYVHFSKPSKLSHYSFFRQSIGFWGCFVWSRHGGFKVFLSKFQTKQTRGDKGRRSVGPTPTGFMISNYENVHFFFYKQFIN